MTEHDDDAMHSGDAPAPVPEGQAAEAMHSGDAPVPVPEGQAAERIAEGGPLAADKPEHAADKPEHADDEAAHAELVPSPFAPDAGDPDETAGHEEDAPTIDEDRLNATIENLCHSKAEEFRMLGYEHVSGKDIWDCVSDKYYKSGIPQLHQIVNDILSLKSTQFMNWMTMRAYKGGSF